MSRRSSRFPELALALAGLLAPSVARAQACCAGSSALTPGRLAIHETALVGAQARAGYGYGSFDGDGHYASNPAGAGEVDLEEDVFGALRFLRRGQVALLVPFVETWRQTRSTGAEFGGGLGDVNASGRWDFVNAGEHEIVPGIGLLAGLTFPTGKPPEDSNKPLATDSTGIGAWQGNLGLALEQTFGAWLVNLSGIVAARTPRTVQGIHSVLAPQIATLAAVAYSFPDDSAVALSATYTFEGNATVNDVEAKGSGRRLLRVATSGTYPLSDVLRLQGSLSFDPPIPQVGKNQPTTVGLTMAVVRSWN